MEHIPAIHAAKVGMRFPARVRGRYTGVAVLDLDLSGVAPGRDPTLTAFLLLDTTLREDEAKELRGGHSVEVVLTDVDQARQQLLASLPAPFDWLTWNGGTVRSLAQRVRDTNDATLFPILADALEDAGCTEAELLARCRDPHGDSLDWLAILLATQE